MLDFITMKHDGEPPARLRAQIQMRLKEKRIPLAFVELLAPFVEKPEDLDEEAMEMLRSVLDLLAIEKLPADEAMRILQAAIAELQASVEIGDDHSEENAEEITAFYQPRAAKSHGLLGAVIAQLRKKSPPATKHTTGRARDLSRESEGARMVAAMSDGLQARMDRRHTPTIGRQYASMKMGDMAMQLVRATGQRPMNVAEAVRMAHSTSDFSLVLENALNKSIARRMEQVAPALARASHEIPAMDYRSGNLLDLSASGMPQEISEGGEIQNVTIDERGEQKPAPRDFGSIFRLSNKAQVNDDTGMLEQISVKMEQGATERFRRVLLEPLLANAGLGNTMADGQPVFHSTHGNLASASATLSVASLSVARLALRSQRGSQGEYYATEPWALVVPPSQETVAQQVLAEINATKLSDVNPFSGTLEIIVEVGLTDPLAWYLIGDPAKTDGLAHSFLDDLRAPRVETKPGWETLGTEFRLVWALDARFVSYASWFKNPGA